MSDLRQAIALSIQEANVSDENKDFTLAASIYRQELVELEQTIKICTVIQDTGLNSILEAIQTEEQREARDRDMAFSLATNLDRRNRRDPLLNVPDASLLLSDKPPTASDSKIKSTADLKVRFHEPKPCAEMSSSKDYQPSTKMSTSKDYQYTSSIGSVSRDYLPKEPLDLNPVEAGIKELTLVDRKLKSRMDESNKGPCISCFSMSSVKLSCNHHYCFDCLKEICLTAIKDISFFPARCCQIQISATYIEQALSKSELDTYYGRKTSLESVSINNIDPEFRKMVLSFGWKICPHCGVGVEKTVDCNHMTCIVCKGEFCYLCNAKWVPRRCSCNIWAPGELEAIIDDRAPYARPAERARLRQVYEHHDTHVHKWTKVYISYRYRKCSSCTWVCNMWYWNCDGCATNRCGKCAFNR
ncbi:hypothetical protein HK103_002365 [Boothiomyces macroporosus]|uniref:RING-type domain-containing protein n=1 Tax=Boothiomyces macroporosus TaxID=261099 RepID=A0AAD5UD79_9FUNG|nr:hypothetical protein HK103_002365 [Boothiomyces macroporosus]